MTGAIERHVHSTTDPDHGHELIRQQYVNHSLAIRGSVDGFRFSIDTLLVGTVAVSRFHHTMAVSIGAGDGLGWPAVVQAHRSHLTFETAKQPHRLDHDDLLAVSPGTPYSAGWQHLDADFVAFDAAMLDDLAGGGPGSGQLVGFTAPVSAAAAEHWRLTVDFVRRVALANAEKADGALLADQLSRLLSSAALTCFANPTLGAATTDPTSGAPEAVRRAVSFIESRPDQPIGLGDIAEAARLSPRALQAGFRRHLDTTPLGYLREVRMDCAHRDLRTARPGDGQTVATIAHRWGSPTSAASPAATEPASASSPGW